MTHDYGKCKHTYVMSLIKKPFPRKDKNELIFIFKQ